MTANEPMTANDRESTDGELTGDGGEAVLAAETFTTASPSFGIRQIDDLVEFKIQSEERGMNLQVVLPGEDARDLADELEAAADRAENYERPEGNHDE